MSAAQFYVDTPGIVPLPHVGRTVRQDHRERRLTSKLWTNGTEADLIDFATRLLTPGNGNVGWGRRLTLSQLRLSGSALVHVDLTPQQRMEALAIGAIPLDGAPLVEVLRAKAGRKPFSVSGYGWRATVLVGAPALVGAVAALIEDEWGELADVTA